MMSKLSISLDPSSPTPLYEQLTSQLRQAIANGTLQPSERVTSIRELAKILNVSTKTIRKTFKQLLDEGWLITVSGSGTYVSDAATVQSAWYPGTRSSGQMLEDGDIRSYFLDDKEEDSLLSHLELGSKIKLMNESFDKIDRYSLNKKPVEIDFRVGTPLVDLLPGDSWSDTLKDWLQELVNSPKTHTDPAGIPELREEIATWLKQGRGLTCSADDVFIVSGAQQARNLIARMMIDKGTRIAFEDPGSIFARVMFQSYGGTIVPVSVDESGLVLEELESTANVSLLYVTPSSQFPTGAVLSKSRRSKIASWAKANNVIIIEDDNSFEFTYESRVMPAIQSFDAHTHTIYMGTFSQTTMPSWRIGYMVVPKAFHDPLYRLKWLTDRYTSPIGQSIILRLFTKGVLKRHIEKVYRTCATRRDVLLRELTKWTANIASFTPVKGGVHQMIWLNSSINDIQVVDRARNEKVGVLAVSPYFLTQPARPGLLLNFSRTAPDKIIRGVSILRDIVKSCHAS